MHEPSCDTNVGARPEGEGRARSGSAAGAAARNNALASFHAARNALFLMMLQVRRLSSGRDDVAAQPILRALANGILRMAALLDELEDDLVQASPA